MLRTLFLATLLATVASISTPADGATPTPVTEVRTSVDTSPGASSGPSAVGDARCVLADGPEYYGFDLFTTRNIPGTGLAEGRADVSVSGSSPFSVALGRDGSYVYDVGVVLSRMKPPTAGTLVAWVTTPDLDAVERVGALDESLRASGTVRWNKFIVVITLEAQDDPEAGSWSGPVAFRGMSRSGMMHTMVGHGALQQENCAAYGYGN